MCIGHCGISFFSPQNIFSSVLKHLCGLPFLLFTNVPLYGGLKRYIRVGYNLDIMRQSACLVLNPITVYSYGFLFNCTTVGQASDSMTALTLSLNWWVVAGCLSVAGPTVAQLEVFFSSDYLFHHGVLI